MVTFKRKVSGQVESVLYHDSDTALEFSAVNWLKNTKIQGRFKFAFPSPIGESKKFTSPLS